MQLSSTDLIEMIGCVIKQSAGTRSFNALAGSQFRFLNCGNVIESGNINNSAFVYASGNGVTGTYANLWVHDGRAAGSITAFAAGSYTGHTIKNCAVS